MSPLPVFTVVKLVSSVLYSISYTGLPLGSLGGSQLSSKPSERMRVTDSSRGTEGAVQSIMKYVTVITWIEHVHIFT